MVAASLRDEVEGITIPTPKSLRPELLRRIPCSRVPVRAVEVQHHLPSPRKPIAVPFELVPRARHHRRKKGIEPPNPLHEQLLNISAGLKLPAAGRMSDKARAGQERGG